MHVEPQGHALLIDGQLVLILVPENADRLRGQTPAQAGEAACATLQLALNETREGRVVQFLVRALGFSLLATLVAGLAVALMQRLRLWVNSRLEKAVTKHRDLLKIGGAPILQTERMVVAARISAGLLYWGLVLFALVMAYPYKELFACAERAGLRGRHRGDHRLRHAVAAGRGDAD